METLICYSLNKNGLLQSQENGTFHHQHNEGNCRIVDGKKRDPQKENCVCRERRGYQETSLTPVTISIISPIFCGRRRCKCLTKVCVSMTLITVSYQPLVNGDFDMLFIKQKWIITESREWNFSSPTQ